MSLLDAWKTAFYHSSSYITQPIGDKSHEILCKLEDIQKKKLESVRNASAPLPLGMKNETRDEHTSTPTTTAEVPTNRQPIVHDRFQTAPLEDDAMMEDDDQVVSTSISSWI